MPGLAVKEETGGVVFSASPMMMHVGASSEDFGSLSLSFADGLPVGVASVGMGACSDIFCALQPSWL